MREESVSEDQACRDQSLLEKAFAKPEASKCSFRGAGAVAARIFLCQDVAKSAFLLAPLYTRRCV
jgi:hypothetical protein